MRTAAALLLVNATLGATIGMGSVPPRGVHRNLRLRGGFPDAAGVAAGKLSALSTRALSPQQRRLGSVRPAYLLRRPDTCYLARARLARGVESPTTVPF